MKSDNMVPNKKTTLAEVLNYPGVKGMMRYCVYMPDDSYVEKIASATPESLGMGISERTESLVRTYRRLEKLGKSGKQVVYPLYSCEEWEDDAQKREVVLMHFPGESGAPFAILASGGGFQGVGSIGESFPTAARLNDYGFHVFALNYRVSNSAAPLMPKPVDDMARAVRFVLDHADILKVSPKNYIVGGYSAGGHITCQFGADEHGYSSYDLPKPGLLLSVYALVYRELRDDATRYHAEKQFGVGYDPVIIDEYNTLLHSEKFPPAYIVHTIEDTVVPYQQSVELYETLSEKGIPCRLDLSRKGKHGFGDGAGTDADGWIDRAVAFYRELWNC